MHNDDILQEIREFREAYAKKFKYDIGAMARDLKEKEKENGHRVVNFRSKEKKVAKRASKSR